MYFKTLTSSIIYSYNWDTGIVSWFVDDVYEQTTYCNDAVKKYLCTGRWIECDKNGDIK